MVAGGIVACLALGQAAHAQTDDCIVAYTSCDGFNGTTIDTSKWTVRDGTVGDGQVDPGDLSMTTTADDDPTRIAVVDVEEFGDRHTVIPGLGGISASNGEFGAGRHEVHMKDLPVRSRCPRFSDYTDSKCETNPSVVRRYADVDIGMPAHEARPWTGAVWRHHLGIDTRYGSDDDARALCQTESVADDPIDARSHVNRLDRRTTGDAGTIRWYVDETLIGTASSVVPTDPSLLRVGARPATSSRTPYDFDTVRMHTDGVKITALRLRAAGGQRHALRRKSVSAIPFPVSTHI